MNLELFDKEKLLIKKFPFELRHTKEKLIYAAFYIHYLIFDTNAIYELQKYSVLDIVYVEL